jgi:hypothetical protein
MKPSSTSQAIGVGGGTILMILVVWFASKGNEATTGFVVVACSTSLALGAFPTWSFRALLARRRTRP